MRGNLMNSYLEIRIPSTSAKHIAISDNFVNDGIIRTGTTFIPVPSIFLFSI